MKTKLTVRLTSVLVTLCMVICCVSFAFANAGAVTIDEDTSVSAAAGSVVENDGFTWDNATVYFLLTDRFRNGDTSNDHSYGRGLDSNGNVIGGIDTRATFHGGDFAGITQAIEEGYFEDLGVNAIWMSAPYEQIHGYVVGDDSSPSYAHYSYHGYYVLDYTESDLNFGTKEEFQKLVDTAHEHGIRVILDIVMNHAGYNSLYDMSEYGFGTLKTGWETYYFSHQNINNSSYHSYIDYESSSTDWGNWWGGSWVRAGLPGYTAGGGDNYTMSLAGLPDFKTESTASVSIPQFLKTKWIKEGTYNEKVTRYGSSNTVTGYLSSWLADWVRNYGVDGFRCDTAKHVEYSSWNTLKSACVDALAEWRQNNPDKPGADWQEDFWMTGEAWDHGVDYDGYYTQGGFDSMINFGTCGGGSLASSSIANLYQGYADSINTNENFNVLSFISSHDELLTRGDTSTMIYNGSALLLTPGGVQIYYGDESNRPMVSGVSFDGYGGAGHSLRSDMNWDSLDQTVLAHWQKVGQFRNNHVAVGAGANTKLTATSGVAFGRTYDKNGVSDKIAAVIAASSNTGVTIDVSSLWSDGQQLMNAYDQSSATVTGGKVTFNSGANGTILIQEPDGRPLLSVTGEAKFTDSQTVTVHLEECESAKCSVDGGNKFIVYDGTTFSIGSTAYEGDTITVTLEAENENGSSTSKSYFYKAYPDEEITEPSTGETEPVSCILSVKTYDNSAPYVYAWTGTNTELCGAWPGTQPTEYDSQTGCWYIDLGTSETYSVVLSNGNGTQSGDIKNLHGDTTLEVKDSSYSSAIVSTGSGSGSEPTEDSVTIRVKSYDGSAPYLYLWDDNKNELNGAWPGKVMTDKDEDGNYVFVVDNASSVSAVVNNNAGGQTGDITALSGEVLIEITDAGCSSYKLTKIEAPLSGMALLKKEAREVKIMTSSDYTADSWANVSALMTSVDALIAQGSEADETEISDMTASLQSAKASLVLAQPQLTYAVTGNTQIKGITAPDADVTVSVNGKTYTVGSDDVTGEFVVEATALTSSSAIVVNVSRNGASSAAYTYNMSNGDINSGVEPTNPELPTTPTVPVTEPTTAPVTEPSTAPVTEPTTEPITQPTTAPVTEPTTDPATPAIMGDVNLDGLLNIDDATYIQMYLAMYADFSEEQLGLADVNGDELVSVDDVTRIQCILVQIY